MSPSSVRRIRPVTILAFISLCGAALWAQHAPVAVPSRIVSPINDHARVTLRGYVHPLANAANDRGPAPDSMPMTRMHLVLKRSAIQEAALKQYIADLHTPGSASYHKWLTPEQFGQQFGPSDQDIATIESWLSAHGFEVTGVEPGRQVIAFNGNAAQMRSAFGTQMHEYRVNGNLHYAAASDPQIPAALAPVVGGFVSLNNFRLKSHLRPLGAASYDPKTGTAQPLWTVNGGEGYPTISGVNFAVTPGDFGVQYDLPNPLLNAKYTGTTYDGTGQTIAIINESNINVALVNQFRSLFGLPVNAPNVIIDGNDPGVDGINNPDGPNYASGEAYLDVEWSGAVAPKATIDLVIAADTATESGLYLALEHAVYSNLAPVMSASFGLCESGLGATNQFLNNLMEQAAAEGITVMVSSGDNGSAGCDDPNSEQYASSGAAVSGFASTPYDVAVGGTDFYYGSGYQSLTLSNLSTYWNTTGSNTPSASLQQPIPEQPWNNSQYGLDASNYYNTYGSSTIGAGSGGASSAAICSSTYSQSNGTCQGTLSGYPKPSWQKGSGVPADNVRDIPDVSLFAADGPNYAYYAMCATDGDCQPNSSGPVQIFGVGGTSAAAPAFAGIMALVNQKYGPQGQANFTLYPMKAQFPAAFHDVTVGTNSVPCNISTVQLSSGAQSPVDCIAVKNPLTVTVSDPSSGQNISVVEGQIGTGTTPEYNAAAGYNLATGLGSVDAAQLVANWGSVTGFASTTATLTSPTNGTSIAVGTAVTISGTITGSTPTGTVALMTSSTTALQQELGVFAVTNGAFSGTLSSLPGGSYQVWAQYSGDGTNAPSMSTPVTVTVTQGSSTTTFSIVDQSGKASVSNSASVSYGTQFLLDALVSGSSTTAAEPTGTVTFSDNGNAINTANLNAEHDAEYNAPFAVGAHSVTAKYSGDASYTGSSGSTIAFTVTKNTPLISLSVSYQNTSSYQTSLPSGQADVLTILVLNQTNITQQSNGSIVTPTNLPYTVPIAAPTGTITIGGIPGVTSAQLAAAVDPQTGAPAGIAEIPIPASAATGTVNLTINYPGDGNYNSTNTSYQLPFSSTGGTTSTVTATMTGSISPTTTVTVSGTVSGTGSAAPSGTVAIYAGGYYLAQVPLVASSALTRPPDGKFRRLNLFATGGGAALACVLLLTIPARRRAWRNFLALVVVICIAGFDIGCGGGNSGSGSTGRLGGGGGGTGSTVSSSFTATLNSQTLLQGSNTITVQYLGDNTYAPSTYTFSKTLMNPLSDFSLLSGTPLVAVSANGSAQASLFVAPTNGFSGTVNLSCSVAGSPAGVGCSLSQSTVALPVSGGNPMAPVVLTITTTGTPAAGKYQVAVTGTSGSQTHTLGVTAAVQ
ncbi:MAG: Ig-like domain repeat protein [Acidobacteriota bacterium]